MMRNKFSLPAQWEIEPVHPWRRCFARFLDTLILGNVAFAILGVALYFINASIFEKTLSFLDKPESMIFESAIVTLCTTFPVAALIASTKTSLGKAIFGIKILNQDDKPIKLKLAFKRELIIWARGMGLGIGIVTLFTCSRSYKYLNYYKNTSWDTELKIKVLYREDDTFQKCLNIFGIVLYLALSLLMWNISSK